MIRVALVSHLSEVSGGGIALLAMAKGLDQARFDPLLVFPGDGPIVERAREGRMDFVIVRNPEESMAAAAAARKLKLAFSRLAYVRDLARTFRDSRTDLVYVNTSLSIFPGIAAWLTRKPIVWHVKETLEHPGTAAKAKMRLIEALSSAVVYDSKSGQEAFPAARVKHRLVARNHIDVNRLMNAVPGPELDRQFAIRPGETVIVSNGIFPRKGADVMLNATGLLRERTSRHLRLVLVGSVAPEHRGFHAKLQEIIARHGIHDMVTFAGVRSDMPELLKRADILVSPSRNEALPIILTEAMAAGTPVVATDVGDCRELLGDGRLGSIVAPEDPAALAEALAGIIASPAETAERAALAQKAILSVYGSEHFWEPLERLMLEAAGKC